MAEYPIIIRGAASASVNILNGAGRLKWCVRDTPADEIDTGWTFLSEIDDEEFLAKEGNLQIVTYQSVIEIEPAILWIYQLPIGTDIQLVIEDGKRYFVDSWTGEKVDV